MSFYSEFAEYYDAVFPFDEDTYAYLRGWFPSEAGRILDIGCGTGDYCGRLASQGYEAVGIDLDQWMVERARKRYPASTFIVMGMEDIGRVTGAFGAAYCIGNTASHLPIYKWSDFLWALREHLQSEAAWIVQTVNWDFVLEQGAYRFPDVEVPGTQLKFERSYPEVSEDNVMFRTRLARGDEAIFEGETTLYPARAADLIRVHRESGFEFIEHRGGFGGEAFDASEMSSNVMVFRRI
jgi:SAM-dependent methyltransferase